ALSRKRAKRFAAHIEGLSPGIDCFSRRKPNAVEKMQRGRFSRLFVCNCETRTSAFLRAIAILCVTHVLSVSGSPERVARQSCARRATAENREEASIGAHTPAG